MLHVTQKKTLSTVIVRLREDARKILVDKYEMQQFNYYIKEVASLAGINESVKFTHRKGNKIIEEVRL